MSQVSVVRIVMSPLQGQTQSLKMWCSPISGTAGDRSALMGLWADSPRRRKGGVVDAGDRLLTPGEVAALFRVDPKTVTRWAAAGRIGSIRTPGGHRRFRESEVRALLSGEEMDRQELEHRH